MSIGWYEGWGICRRLPAAPCRSEPLPRRATAATLSAHQEVLLDVVAEPKMTANTSCAKQVWEGRAAGAESGGSTLLPRRLPPQPYHRLQPPEQHPQPNAAATAPTRSSLGEQVSSW